MNKGTNYREAFPLKLPSSNFTGKSELCDSIRAPTALSFNLSPLDTCFPQLSNCSGVQYLRVFERRCFLCCEKQAKCLAQNLAHSKGEIGGALTRTLLLIIPSAPGSAHNPVHLWFCGPSGESGISTAGTVFPRK